MTKNTDKKTNKKADLKYKRILLKISGEALMGNQDFGIAPEPVEMIAKEIKKAQELGAQIGVVVGGGNIFRGMKNSSKLGMDQASGDYVGMLATVMNAIALQSALRKIDVPCRVQSAIDINKIAEPYIRFKAIRHLEKDRVVIFAAGKLFLWLKIKLTEFIQTTRELIQKPKSMKKLLMMI